MPLLPSSNKGLPKRLLGGPAKLVRKTCLRCSKHIAVNPTHRCGYKDFQKCGACARKRKTCHRVPRKFIPEVNHLLALARDLDGSARRVTELEAAQRRYTRRVQAYIRVRERHGLTHRPNNPVEAAVLVVEQLEKLNETLSLVLDVMRFEARLDPIVADSESESDEDTTCSVDEDEDEE